MSNELEPTDKAMDSKDEISSDEEEEDSEEEQTSEEGSGDEEEGSGDEEDGSGDESEDSGSSEEEEDRTGYQYEDPGSASDSSGFDSTSESCSICLVRLKNQTIGTPETCDHNFCLECILEWSRNVNTCPVDRQVFNLILARDSLEGVVFKKIPVEDKQLQLQDELAQDVTPCEVCGSGESEDTLLLCDGCDLAYHMACLDTPLSRVPEGDWFCPTCSITIDDKCRVCHSAAREEEMLLCDECNQGYHMDCLVPPLRAIPVADWFCANCAGSSLSEQDERPATSTNHRSHPTPDRPRRQIARTLVSERVRAAIFRNRRSRRQIISSDSDSEEENIGDSPTAAEAATVRRPPIKRKTPVKSKKKKVPTATLR